MSSFDFMDYTISLSKTLRYDSATKTFSRVEAEVIQGHDLDELFDIMTEAWNEAREFSVEVGQHDPTPQYLYDNDGGEPAISANERHSQAFAQHQALHS
jgi:hypothetical protein